MDAATIAAILGAAVPVGGILWRISHNTGQSSADLRHMRESCDKFEKQYEAQVALNADHEGRLSAVESTVQHHGKLHDQAHEAITELRAHHHTRTSK